MMRVVALALVLLAASCMPTIAQSGLHGDGHAEHHDEYSTWKQPSGASCCSDADCRPTRARPGPDGWEAWDGNEWVPIPPEKVLPFHARDGRSHLCANAGSVYCFTPAEPKG